MTGRCEGYVGEVWVVRKITPGKRGRSGGELKEGETQHPRPSRVLVFTLRAVGMSLTSFKQGSNMVSGAFW